MDSKDILEILGDHVGTGDIGPMAMQRLCAILPHIPAPTRSRGGRLWRAIHVSEPMLQTHLQGRDIAFTHRPLSFWTRSRAVAAAFSRNLAEVHLGRGGILVLEREVMADRVAIDVPEVFRHFHAWSPDYPGWDLFSREEEVVLREDPGPFVIRPDMVCHALSCQAPELKDPFPGESVALEEGECEIRSMIERLDEQRYHVATSNGEKIIQRDRYGWMADPDDQPEP